MNLFKNPQTNWKYILIVVILAFLVSGGILWFSTKQEVPIEFFEIKKPEKVVKDETANWKTSTIELPPLGDSLIFSAAYPCDSSSASFSLKYPQDWIVEYYENKYPFLSIVDSFGNKYSLLLGWGHFGRLGPTDKITEENVIYNNYKATKTLSFVGGKLTYLSTSILEEESSCQFLFEMDLYETPDQQDKNIIEQVDKILNTITFFGMKKVTDEWKTYQNEWYEIKYPTNWFVELQTKNEKDDVVYFKDESDIRARIIFLRSHNTLPDNPENLSLEEWLAKSHSTYLGKYTYYDPESIERILIGKGNYTGFETLVEYTRDDWSHVTGSLFVSNNDFIFNIAGPYFFGYTYEEIRGGKHQEMTLIFNRMLYNFRFLE